MSIMMLSFLLTTCAKKDDPVLQNGTPVFSITGMINNTAVEYIAGQNSFYMDADYRSDSLQVYGFMGTMKKTCTGCKESLRVIIRNYQSGSAAIDPSQAFYNGSYLYTPASNAINKSLLLTLSAAPSGNGTVTHLWDFGDGTFSTQANPIKNYPAGSKYSVSYTASYSTGCSSNLTLPVGLDPYHPAPPNVSFTYTTDTSAQSFFLFNAIGDTGANITYFWDFGDAITATGTNVTHQYTTPGVFMVSLRYTKNTDTVIVNKNIRTLKNTSCMANFNYRNQPVTDPINASTVTVEWTDANGAHYSSDQVLQDDGSNFNIISSAPYITNEKGQATRALDVVFTCKVSNGTQTIELKNIRGHIAVAHP